MSSIQDVGVTPSLVQSVSTAANQAEQSSGAQMSVMMDSLRLSGGLVVQLLESMPSSTLGTSIDCYA